MSNKIYEEKFFNVDRKMKFIEENGYKEGTTKIILRIFKISQIIESELDKDLCDFNRDELRRLGFLFAPKTEASSNSNMTWLSKYISWCLDTGIKRGLNPLDAVSVEWKRQFANSAVKQLWTDKEIADIINPTKRANYQDSIIILLLFIGVRGSGNSEILNLREKDVDVHNNELHLRDDNNPPRFIKVDENVITMCKKALAEDFYEKMNGDPSPDIKAPRAQLVDNDYLVKSAITRTHHYDQSDKNIIHRRLTKIADELGEPHFTPMNIARSGQLALAKNIYLATGELTEGDIQGIAKQFGEDSDSAVYRLKNDLLTIENIKSVYQLP